MLNIQHINRLLNKIVQALSKLLPISVLENNYYQPVFIFSDIVQIFKHNV